MKKIFVLIVLIFVTEMVFAPVHASVSLVVPVIKKETFKNNLLSHLYIKKMAIKESGNNPDKVHISRRVGLFGFGDKELAYFGAGITVEEFIINPNVFPREAQVKLLIKFTRHNKRILRKYIKMYDGKVVNGVLITESGILAAAHLSGAGGVIKFFEEGYVSKDMHNTSIITYLKHFQNV